jgi:dolichol kinase
MTRSDRQDIVLEVSGGRAARTAGGQPGARTFSRENGSARDGLSAPVAELVPASSSDFSYSAELGRKALHLLALVIPLGMWGLGRPLALLVLGLGAGIAVCADVVRAYCPTANAWIRRLFGPLMRAEELPEVGSRVTFNGATCVLVGAALLALLFPLRVAVPVLTMTMLADAAAALVGRRLGRHPWGSLSATVEGSAAFVLTGLAVMFAFPSLALGPAVLSVLAAAVVEAVPMPVNDNIRVPLTAAVIVAVGEALLLPPHLAVSPGL